MIECYTVWRGEQARIGHPVEVGRRAEPRRPVLLGRADPMTPRLNGRCDQDENGVVSANGRGCVDWSGIRRRVEQ
jgi:hypothetical protein